MKRFLAGIRLLLALALLVLPGKLAQAQTPEPTLADLIKIAEDELKRRGFSVAGYRWEQEPQQAEEETWTLSTVTPPLTRGGGWLVKIAKSDRRVLEVIGQR